MAEPTTWYRVSFDKDGKLQGIRAVDKQHKPGERIFYVVARDKHQALELARTLWKEYANEEARTALAARRAKNEADGLCRCGRPRDREDVKKCADCRALDNNHNSRYEKRKRGETVKPLDRRTVLRERKRRDALKIAATAYEDALEASKRCNSLGELRRWLHAKITKIDHELNGIPNPQGKVA